MEIIGGIIGFLGYECLKIYKNSWRGKHFPPSHQLPVYIVSLVGLAAFSGYLAKALVSGNLASAIFVGFSLPANAKAIFGSSSLEQSFQVDDIELAKPSFKVKLRSWFDLIF